MNVIPFNEKATTILHNSYTTTSEDEVDENLRNIQDVCSNIFKILESGNFNVALVFM